MAEPNTVDLTPSWEAAAEILILVLEQGPGNARLEAREELRRMAKIADAAIDKNKELKALRERVQELEIQVENLEDESTHPDTTY